MTPYYDDGRITIYHGDCREITAWLDADVLVTDPPYGMRFQSNRRQRACRLPVIIGDLDPTTRDEALAMWGAARPALVFGRWSVAPPTGERLRIIWWKESTPGMGDLSMPWGPAHEDIHVLGRGWNRAATGHKRVGSVITTRAAVGGAAGPGNATGHPTPKPVGLMERLLERCPPGAIADPFMGSGSTLVAAKALGRRAIGVEVDERYCEIAARRLDQGVLELTSEVPA